MTANIRKCPDDRCKSCTLSADVIDNLTEQIQDDLENLTGALEMFAHNSVEKAGHHYKVKKNNNQLPEAQMQSRIEKIEDDLFISDIDCLNPLDTHMGNGACRPSCS